MEGEGEGEKESEEERENRRNTENPRESLVLEADKVC